MPRTIENRMLNYLRQGKISKWFSGIGQKPISVGATYALENEDIILPMHRNLGVFTTRDVNSTIILSINGKGWWIYKRKRQKFPFWFTI